MMSDEFEGHERTVRRCGDLPPAYEEVCEECEQPWPCQVIRALLAGRMEASAMLGIEV